MAYAEPYDKENTQQTNLRRKNKLQPGRIQTVPPGLFLAYAAVSRYQQVPASSSSLTASISAGMNS